MKDKNKIKRQKYQRRQRRTRAKLSGTRRQPRLSIFRSLSHIYAQAIDDVKGHTLAAVSDRELKLKGKKSDIALAVGKRLGEILQEKKIQEIVFDRGAYKFHGRVKALAEGLRQSGIKF